MTHDRVHLSPFVHTSRLTFIDRHHNRISSVIKTRVITSPSPRPLGTLLNHTHFQKQHTTHACFMTIVSIIIFSQLSFTSDTNSVAACPLRRSAVKRNILAVPAVVVVVAAALARVEDHLPYSAGD